MKYTIQLHIAGYASPMGTDVEHHNSLASAREALRQAQREAQRYGAGYDTPLALGYIGHLEDVTDIYPDFKLTLSRKVIV